MRRLFLDHIELWLSGAGLAVVWLSTLAAPHLEPWKVAAVTALGVSVLHGLIFWVVRRRQRQIRYQAVHEIREMLTDEVKNQLAVIGASLPSSAFSEYAEQIDDVTRSIETIGVMMDDLTEERVSTWKRTYANAKAQWGSSDLVPA